MLLTAPAAVLAVLCCALVVVHAAVPDYRDITPIAVPLSIDPSQVAVAGLSAGGFFAAQFHVAFSSHLVGAAILAGGPFYCAKDSLTYAEVDCQYVPSQINLGELEDAARACAAGHVCDDLANLTNTRVYFFSGTSDTVVNPGVVVAARQFYLDLGTPADQLKAEFSLPAEHCFPTNSFGDACGHLGSPYINNCDYDAASDLLNFLFGGNLNPPVPANASNLHSLNQQDYTPDKISPASVSLGDLAYVYVPTACSQANAGCKLVINMHGCAQTLPDIGFDYIGKIGVNEVAEANNIVVLYPQAIKSFFNPSNPEGCFDWWGYTNSDYSNQRGVQMATVYNMVQALLAGGPAALVASTR